MVKRLNQELGFSRSGLSFVWGNTTNLLRPSFPSLPNVCFVFIFTFPKFNNLCRGEKMNSLGEAKVGAKSPTLLKLFPYPPAYRALLHLALSGCLGGSLKTTDFEIAPTQRSTCSDLFSVI